MADLEANDHDDEGDHHDDGVTTLEPQLVTLTPGKCKCILKESSKRDEVF